MAREDAGTTVGLLPLFCRRLARLQKAAGLTQTSLAAAAKLGTSQMSAILNGDIKQLPDWNVVRKVVDTCLAHAKEAGKFVPPDLRDKVDWRRRYEDLEQDLEAAAPRRSHPRASAGRTVETVRQCHPFDLGVHRALPPTDTASFTGGAESLTPYLKRDHDNQLRAVLHRAAGAGPSVFAVLAGDSCTGKTRALYEALLEVVPDWPLLRPTDADELLELLQEDRFRAGTVLWLNETQHYLDGSSGEQAAALLRKKLAAINGAVAVAALWRHPYLEELTATGNSPDVHAAARTLLDGPRAHRITVPDRLTGHQQQELAVLADTDKRLEAALAASGPDGDVIQHLTVGPELLHAYTSGGLFTPVEHALITAALDARRLGHQEPIPAALLAAAADGYLSRRQRPGHHDWATSALTGLAIGMRPDGRRTDVRHALPALKAVRERSGDVETGYEPDDYLDQHTRRHRQACPGPRHLWDALAEHTTSPDDLYRLGDAARARGFYRHAALLWKYAIATGNAMAAHELIELLHALSRDSTQHAAHWVAVHVNLDDPFGISQLLAQLHMIGADQAVSTLLARHPAAYAALDDPLGISQLLKNLRGSGADQEVATLAARVATHVDLAYSLNIGALLRELREARADQEVATLAAHVATHVDLEDPKNVALRLYQLREAGAYEEVATLALRAAAHVALEDPENVALLLWELRVAGADQAVSTLLARHPAAYAALEDPRGVAGLLWGLREAEDSLRGSGADQEVSTLLARHPAAHVALEDPRGVAGLLENLHMAGAYEEVATLALRAAAHVALEDPKGVAELLENLHMAGAYEEVATLALRAAAHVALEDPEGIAQLLKNLRGSGADQEVSTLLARHPAAHVALDPAVASAERAVGVSLLLRELREVGADEAARTLVARAADSGLWRLSLMEDPTKARRYTFGREPDGTVSPPWDWQDLAEP